MSTMRERLLTIAEQQEATARYAEGMGFPPHAERAKENAAALRELARRIAEEEALASQPISADNVYGDVVVKVIARLDAPPTPEAAGAPLVVDSQVPGPQPSGAGFKALAPPGGGETGGDSTSALRGVRELVQQADKS